jgi:hypothetical protein
MKKVLATLAFAALASQSVYATTARLISLGLDELDNEGSYYIQDGRNVFLNPAFVHNVANTAIVELGGNGNGVSATSNSFVDQDDKPKAQGGFFKTYGNYVYGAYLGNESNTSSFLRIASTSTAASMHATAAATSTPLMLPSADNQLDLFLGSTLDNGVKWGANLVYLKNKNEGRKEEEKAGAIRFGADGGNWDAHANISFMNTAKNQASTNSGNPNLGSTNAAGVVNQEFDGSLGVHLGGSYQLGKGRLYGFYKTFTWDQKDDYNYTGWADVTVSGKTIKAGKTGTGEGKFDTYSVGYGVSEKVSNAGSIFTNVQLKMIDIELKLAQTIEVKNTVIPLTFGYEHQANSWLVFRGSVTQNIYGQKDNKNLSSANLIAQNLVTTIYGAEGKGSIANSTRVNAGASLTFGKLVVDGVIGAVNNANTVSTTSQTNGIFKFDALMTRAALSYAF